MFDLIETEILKKYSPLYQSFGYRMGPKKSHVAFELEISDFRWIQDLTDMIFRNLEQINDSPMTNSCDFEEKLTAFCKNTYEPSRNEQNQVVSIFTIFLGTEGSENRNLMNELSMENIHERSSHLKIIAAAAKLFLLFVKTGDITFTRKAMILVNKIPGGDENMKFHM